MSFLAFRLLFCLTAMGSDDEGSASDDGSLRTAGHALDYVPVDIHGAAVAKLRCKLCSSKATEPSPLALSNDVIKTWNGVRMPKGNYKIGSTR